jgi:shikimate 5-dehydrogenase
LELRSISADAADDLLSSRHILAGLLGAPIAHSASPAMHERAAEALGRARGGTKGARVSPDRIKEQTA